MTLSDLRKRANLTQMDAMNQLIRLVPRKKGDKAKISRTSVSRWENGATEPSPKWRAAMAKLYGVPVADIYEAFKQSQQEAGQ